MLLFNYPKLEQLLDGGAAGGGTTPPPGTPPPGAAAGGTATGPKWEDLVKSLPEELQKDPSLTPIKDFTNLTKSFINAQKAMGSKVNLPDPKHATETDYLDILKRMGAVEKSEDFKFKLPDGVTEDKLDKEFMTKLKDVAVKTGVLPWQFEKIFATYNEVANARVAAATGQFTQKAQEQITQLKTEWGQGFETQVKKANVAFKELVPNEEDRKALIADGLGGHPVVMKILANASKYFKEDVFLGQGAGEFTGMTPADALKKAGDIMGNPEHPYRRKDHPNHAAAKEEVQNLFKMAYPEPKS
jgi:hypothetical protein